MSMNLLEIAQGIVKKDNPWFDGSELFKSTKPEDLRKTVFARLFHQLLLTQCMSAERLHELFMIYADKPGNTRKQDSDARRRFAIALSKPDFGYETYLRGLHLLRVSHLRLTAAMEFGDEISVTASTYLPVIGI